jgi:hypothetical protein
LSDDDEELEESSGKEWSVAKFGFKIAFRRLKLCIIPLISGKGSA